MSVVEPPSIETEQQLLAEPPEEYMSERQLAYFRGKLLEQRDELLRSAENTLSELRDRVPLADEADRATVEGEHTLALRMRDRERRLLRKVEQALLRIEQGQYGWCEETGEPIGLRRLLARPTATLSIEGQERKEARQRTFRDRRTGA